MKDAVANFLPDNQEFEKEILNGLSQSQKNISPKFLYDERGSQIFEQICGLPEYYPVHAEHEILKEHAGEIAGWIGKNVILIEPGCGNCVKVQYLLETLDHPSAYVALDISKDFLVKITDQIQNDFPEIPVYPMVADYTRRFSIPKSLEDRPEKRVIFFPGSTIGNLHPEDAQSLLTRMSELVGSGGGLLIGVDMKKDTQTLELAYDDPQGVTAEFNYNLLDRLNREFSGSFERKNFKYLASYNEVLGRVEMFLVSKIPQWVKIAEQSIHLNQNETIHTENSYKYTPDEFIGLAKTAGFQFLNQWTDHQNRFAVYYFERPQ